MITIAVTGGMGAGKTETTKILEALGAVAIHADEVAHQTYEPGAPAFAPLMDAFGSQILAGNGRIDRRILGALAFGDAGVRKRLEEIVWGETKRSIANLLGRYRSAGVAAVVIEAAVLYEAGWDDLADAVVTVEAPESVRKRRIKLRTGMSDVEIRKRFAAQLSCDQRIERADYHVNNDSELNDLSKAVHAVWKQAIQ